MNYEPSKTSEMRTTDLFKKHFGGASQVDMKHPNVEAFFSELNEICKKEDERYCIREHLFLASTQPIVKSDLTYDEAVSLRVELTKRNDDPYLFYTIEKQ